MLRAVCFPGAWRSWLSQVACLHLKCWTIYFKSICNSNPCFFVSERSGQSRCTGIQRLFNGRAVQQSYVRVCTLLPFNREHCKAPRSTVAQSPLPKAANNQVSANPSMYQKKYVSTCMLRLICFRGAWSFWHLQFACVHLKCWTIFLLHLSVIPIHSSERASVAGGTAR